MNRLMIFVLFIFPLLSCDFSLKEVNYNNPYDRTGDAYNPIKVTMNPADGATGVPVASDIVLTFDRPVKQTGWLVKINGRDYTTGTFDASGQVLTITPSGKFIKASTATVVLYDFRPGDDGDVGEFVSGTGFSFSIEWEILSTWISGDTSIGQPGIYGIIGSQYSTKPGARKGSISWKDSSGNLWLFGGNEYDYSNNLRNDLWKFDGEKWIWISGDDTPNQFGLYGTKGTAASTNKPGGREKSISWTDSSGNLWLFGGNGYAESGNAGYLNDLWKFDGTNWTWVSGDSTLGQPVEYGTKGTGNSLNNPGGRSGAVSWIDSSGNLWLFGGVGYDSAGSNGYLNDLWKFDGTNWTWVSGDNIIGQIGEYGIKGIASSSNKPGARDGAAAWIDSSNNLWLFGGYVGGEINDLWKFDGTNWTWVSGDKTIYANGIYGIKGIASSSNKPGARDGAAAWIDSSNNLWLFGGYGFAETGSPHYLNDLWKFDGTNWTWISGEKTDTNPTGIYGRRGTPSSSNTPGGRESSIVWTDSSGNLWLFGGYGNISSPSYYGSFSDLWRFDGTNWAWISGDMLGNQPGYYGIKGTASIANKPGGRGGSNTWMDASGNFWLFGGFGFGSSSIGVAGNLNDLWKFDGSKWIWVAGDSIANQYSVYGIKGVASSLNKPGARHGAVSCIDSSGNFWLFGGLGFASSGNSGWLNDLWKFDGINWTWVSGDDTASQIGIYGTMGVSSLSNKPGGRGDAVLWIDSSGILWLFGGTSGDGTYGLLNDLWKFDGTSWTWISGDSSADNKGIYGTKGISSPSNKPGGRSGAFSWIDSSGNFWVFGGTGYSSYYSGYLNDLWKFDGISWTWVSGDNNIDQSGVYGIKGSPSPSNKPGGHGYGVSWKDESGAFWLFGGLGFGSSSTGVAGDLNDLWKFDGTNWTWISGDNVNSIPGIYGSMGIVSSQNKPGSRCKSALWKDASGNVWIFGGQGHGADITPDYGYLNDFLNDLWKLE